MMTSFIVVFQKRGQSLFRSINVLQAERKKRALTIVAGKMFVPRALTVAKPKKVHQTEDKTSLLTNNAKQMESIVAVSKDREDKDCISGAATWPRPRSASSERVSDGFAETEKDPKAEEDEKVVEKSEDQRYPQQGEPVCVICGRYGAYICDKTDKDVCSIECKLKNLNRNESAVNLTYPGMLDDETEEGKHREKSMSPSEFEKFFNESYKYKEHFVIASLEQAKIDFLREKLEIKLQGDNIPSLIIEFNHCGFHKGLKENLLKSNYLTPTPIQMQAIPVGLSGRDLIACAQTATGKSASFLLPLIQRVSAATGSLEYDSPSCMNPLALILCPTRELCMQLEDQAKTFSKGLPNMKTALVIGGNPLPQQVHRLKQGVQIVIATPGRLYEIIEKHEDICNLEYLQIVVLDEVDTMLKLGFQAQVDKILDRVPKSSQKMMFSATIPPAIEKIASKLLKDPVFISIGEPSAPNKSVKQIILWVEETAKKKRLFEIIKDKRHFHPPAVIFVDSKLGADMLSDAVNKVCGITCASLHGDKLQSERTEILNEFLNGSYEVLVSTSLLGRGIDLLNVKMVINFDMPSSVDEYIHQVGRAGKLDSRGFAITFLNNNNKDVFLKLTETLQNAEIRVPDEILNSPYLEQQKAMRMKKTGKHSKGKRKEDELVTTGNLMDMLKEYTKKRKP